MIFVGGGGYLGGTDNLWGGGARASPAAPRSYAPATGETHINVYIFNNYIFL